jgi:general secretion pathway protein N
MKPAIAMGKYVSGAMLLLSVCLAAAIFLEWEQGSQLAREVTKIARRPASHAPELDILPAFVLPDAESGFPELLSRPMFFASRRPAANPNQGAGAMKKGLFTLVGVVITPTQHAALLRDVATGKTERLELGGLTKGMTLDTVEANRIVLRQGGESEDLTLKVQVGMQQPSASPGGPTPGPGGPSPMQTPSGGPQPMPQPTPPPPGMSPETRALSVENVKHINAERAKRGIPPIDFPTAR